MGFVVLNIDVKSAESNILEQVIHDVREKIGPVAAFKKAVVVAKLPKTRSGKTLRGTIRKIVHGETYEIPATIEDASALDVIQEAII